jgi:hypothetical protein
MNHRIRLKNHTHSDQTTRMVATLIRSINVKKCNKNSTIHNVTVLLGRFIVRERIFLRLLLFKFR